MRAPARYPLRRTRTRSGFPCPGALCKKERESVERGQKQAGWRDSFILMLNERWTHGMAGMALGALAAYFGMRTSQPDFPLLPLAFTVSGAIAGCVILSRAARRTAHSARLRFGAEGLENGNAPAALPETGGSALLGHEIKNYLCTLKGNARLLRQRVPSDDQAIIDRIDRVVEKLESFTHDLSGPGGGALNLGSLEQVRPAEAARGCVRTHFEKRSGSFRFNEDSGVPALLCDPGRLEQVLLNLYANALEAGAGRIDTEVRRRGSRMLIRIEDDGHGCAQEDLARIFEPFFTTKAGPARRGLGMFIVQSIVENHGGRIRVESKNGKADGGTGLIFTLDFPLFRDGRETQSRVAARHRPAPLIAASAVREGTWLLAPPALP